MQFWSLIFTRSDLSEGGALSESEVVTEVTQPESGASANSAIPAIMLLFTDGAQTACHHYDSFIIIPRRGGFVKREFSFSGSFFQEVHCKMK